MHMLPYYEGCRDDRYNPVLTDMQLKNVINRFKTEEACIHHLFRERWPEGFVCPACGGFGAYEIRTRRLPLYQCKNCRHQTSLIAGTVMEGSRTPLCKWMVALQLMSLECGVTAVRLASILSVTYKTAWRMLHKIRLAISRLESNEPLTGEIKIGLAHYGRFKSMRVPRKQPVLVGISLQYGTEPNETPPRRDDRDLMRSGNRPASRATGPSEKRSLPAGNTPFSRTCEKPLRVKMKLIPQKESEHPRFVENYPEFVKLQQRPGFCRIQRIPPLTPRLGNMLPQLFCHAKTWIDRTFHGLGTKHAQLYWDEFCYRRNLSFSEVPVFPHLTRLCLSSAV